MLPLGAISPALAECGLQQSGRSLAHERMSAVEPYLAQCGQTRDFVGLPGGTLLHAGPPVLRHRPLSPTLLGAAIAAACREGMAKDQNAAREMIQDGSIALRPAQDFNVVTTLDYVVGPSSDLACVEDRNDVTRRAFVPAPPDAVPYELGVDVALGGVLLELDATSVLSRMAAGARKCVLLAGEGLPECTVITALATNGTAIGLQISCLGRRWLSTDDLWLRFFHPQLRRTDRGILASGDLLLRHALNRRGGGSSLGLLDATDRLYGVESPMMDMLRQVPAGLFTMGLSKVRPVHWSLFIPPH
jgi:hypothetical protein